MIGESGQTKEYQEIVIYDTDLRAEATEERKPEVAHGEGEVLIEEVSEELAHAVVGPAAVHEQQALQEAELRDGVVRRQHRLHALLPRYAHADVRGCTTTQGILVYTTDY